MVAGSTNGSESEGSESSEEDLESESEDLEEAGGKHTVW